MIRLSAELVEGLRASGDLWSSVRWWYGGWWIVMMHVVLWCGEATLWWYDLWCVTYQSNHVSLFGVYSDRHVSLSIYSGRCFKLLQARWLSVAWFSWLQFKRTIRTVASLYNYCFWHRFVSSWLLVFKVYNIFTFPRANRAWRLADLRPTSRAQVGHNLLKPCLRNLKLCVALANGCFFLEMWWAVVPACASHTPNAIGTHALTAV